MSLLSSASGNDSELTSVDGFETLTPLPPDTLLSEQLFFCQAGLMRIEAVKRTAALDVILPEQCAATVRRRQNPAARETTH